MSRYICIEGNIGAGKTTLAKKLSEYLNAQLVLEEFEENSFLTKFYKQPERYAFPLEMSFLAERYHQLNKVLNASEDLFREQIVSDYTLTKSMLFAGNNLKGHELKLYMDFHQMVTERVRQPDLVVYLQRPIETIVKHIEQRGREFEKNISIEYLIDIGERYQNMIRSMEGSKCLVLNADEYDFLAQKNDLKKVVHEINEVLNTALL